MCVASDLRRLLAAVVVVAALVAGGRDSAAQVSTSPPPSGLILGRVVDAATNAPIPGVVVNIRGIGAGTVAANDRSAPRSVLTDAQGRFVFRSLPKGSYTMTATIGGTGFAPGGFIVSGVAPQIGPYVYGGFGQRVPGGPLQSIDLDDREHVGDAVIRMWKGGSIDGTVLDEVGEPVVNVAVAAAKRSSDGRLLNGPLVATDDRGAYHISTLVPGDYVVVVPLTQTLMPAATVDALQAPGGSNGLLLLQMRSAGAATNVGGYQIRGSIAAFGTGTSSNIPPSSQAGSLYIYPTTFAPSTTSAGRASVVTVHSGEERQGVNVQLIPVRAVSVSGVLADSSGPVPNFGVHLMPPESTDGSGLLEVATTSTDGHGVFQFPLVPPGAYRVAAIRDLPLPTAPGTEPSRVADRAGAWATQTIAVGNQDLDGVTLQLRRGVRLSGHVDYRGSASPPSGGMLKSVVLSIEGLDPMSRSRRFNGSVPLDANFDFALQDIPPGRYLLRMPFIDPVWTLAGVAIGGRDVTDRAITIEDADVSDVTVSMADRATEIGGTVRDRSGAADVAASILLFPTDRSAWRDARSSRVIVRSLRVSKTGAFRISSLIPGEYYVVAVVDETAVDFPDAGFLARAAAGAKTVRVAVGDKATLALSTYDVPKPSTGGDSSEVSLPAAGRPVVKRQDRYVESDRDPSIDSVSPSAVGRPRGRLSRDGRARRSDLRAAQSGAAVAPMLGGIVTTDATPGLPLRRVLVTVTGSEITGSRQVVTDDDGHFAFVDLAPGRYSIVAEKPAYLKTYDGSKRLGRPPSAPVAVSSDHRVDDLVIRMARGAVIAGSVRDPNGMAVSSAQVSVRQPILVNGERKFVDVPDLLVPRATTDDKGRYRLYGLPPGDYSVLCGAGANIVNVTETSAADIEDAVRELQRTAGDARSGPPPSTSRPLSLARGTADVSALAVGEERTGVDIALSYARPMKVSGTSLGPDGSPLANVSVAIVNAGERSMWGSPGLIMPDAVGHFTVPPLTAGKYALVGRAGDNGAPASSPMLFSGEVDFDVYDQDVSGLVLQFERGVTVAGRLALGGSVRTLDLTKLRMRLAPIDSLASFGPAPPPASIQADGSFTFDGIGPGKYRLAATLAAPWTLRSAMVNGRDTLDGALDVQQGQAVAGLVVTLTDTPTELSGTLSDAAGHPTSVYSMLAFSTDRSMWTTAPRRVSGAVRLSSDGKYRITGLPPGEYYLAAISDFDPVQLSDPTFLEDLIARSLKITLGEGEKKVQDVKVGVGSGLYF